MVASPRGWDALPAGYIAFESERAHVVAEAALADAVRAALYAGTLYAFAASQSDARPLAGRGTAYAVALPGPDARVVVRHNRHGGMLARVTGDRFWGTTRAPRELRISERLRDIGVPTPRIACYCVYPSLSLFARADVATHEVPDAHDLSHDLCAEDSERRARALAAAAAVVSRLSAAGARHHDLNVKNILLHDHQGVLEALVLDVDRVTFDLAPPLVVLEQNLARLIRSAEKWRRRGGARVTDAELASLRAMCTSPNSPPPRAPN